jgi:hypothetical protein
MASDSGSSRSSRANSEGSSNEHYTSSPWSSLSEHESSQYGGHGSVEPIAIIGMSCRLGGDATDTSSLWDMLKSGRTAWTPGPGKRFNMEAFQDPTSHRPGTVSDPPQSERALACKGSSTNTRLHRLIPVEVTSLRKMCLLSMLRSLA